MVINETELSKCNKCYKSALAQFRGTMQIEAINFSRYRIKTGSSCGYPGEIFSRICHGSSNRKNHDELIEHTVRVKRRAKLKSFVIQKV